MKRSKSAPHIRPSRTEVNSNSGQAPGSQLERQNSSPRNGGSLQLSDFVLRKKLGSGSFATVFHARKKPSSNADALLPVTDVALKAISKSRLDIRAERFLKREISIHRRVSRHPNIATFYHVFEDPKKVFLVLEYLRGPDLITGIAKYGAAFGELQAVTIVDQVLDALEYMHSLGCAHRDIKLENVLFTEPPNYSERKLPAVRLIDFGFSIARDRRRPVEERRSSEKCGTFGYAAPEIFGGKPYVPERCDIWSIGVLMYALLSTHFPFKAETPAELTKEIRTTSVAFDGRKWNDISQAIKSFIRSCLKRRPSERPNASDARRETQEIIRALQAKESRSSRRGAVLEGSSSRQGREEEPRRGGDLLLVEKIASLFGIGDGR